MYSCNRATYICGYFNNCFNGINMFRCHMPNGGINIFMGLLNMTTKHIFEINQVLICLDKLVKICFVTSELIASGIGTFSML